MDDKRDRWRRYWDKHSKSYDREMRFFDRVLFKDSRGWVCSQAVGETLEVGIGTGLNLPFYPGAVRLTGIDLSPAMLAIARRQASRLDHPVDLREADAHALPFDDGSFDTVVCTFSLCAIPDERRAIGEMYRVLRPAGRLLLADHVAGSRWLVRAVQRLLEVVTIPTGGEHFLRRPSAEVKPKDLRSKNRSDSDWGSSSGSQRGSPDRPAQFEGVGHPRTAFAEEPCSRLLRDDPAPLPALQSVHGILLPHHRGMRPHMAYTLAALKAEVESRTPW
jgi:ubiquinone/menaquinone biosynthesis C-methylase UbiE